LPDPAPGPDRGRPARLPRQRGPGRSIPAGRRHLPGACPRRLGDHRPVRSLGGGGRGGRPGVGGGRPPPAPRPARPGPSGAARPPPGLLAKALPARPDPEAGRAILRLSGPTLAVNVSSRLGLTTDALVVSAVLGSGAVTTLFVTQRLAALAQLQLLSIGNASW